MGLSRAKAMAHKCHQCMGEYVDGKVDCEIVTCPIYAWMPYRKRKPSLDWENRTPYAVGKRGAKAMSDETKRKLAANLQAARARIGK